MSFKGIYKGNDKKQEFSDVTNEFLKYLLGIMYLHQNQNILKHLPFKASFIC